MATVFTIKFDQAVDGEDFALWCVAMDYRAIDLGRHPEAPFQKSTLFQVVVTDDSFEEFLSTWEDWLVGVGTTDLV